MTQAKEIFDCLESFADEKQARQLMRFFKTGKGQYGEGDHFLGLKVPQTRAVVKEAALDVPFEEIEKLIYSPWHEARLAGFLLLVEEMKASLSPKRGTHAERAKRRDYIAAFYLRHARQANNWDLVDLSCPKILGIWLLNSCADRSILDRLVASENLWEQRIGIVTTWQLIHESQFEDTLRLATKLLNHPHDLIHKATGWILREVGKKDTDTLIDFLGQHYASMPRTALRYAIEKLPEPQRQYWLFKRPEKS